VAGINDIGNFWAGVGTKGITGMYQAGFFPIMMFGLIGAAFAIYKTAKPEKKKEVASLMLAAGFASFLTGVTEPLEFSFMFVAPILYLIHAILTGISLAISAFFHWTAGFGFSAGLIDFILSSRLPLANKPYMLLIQGLIFGLIYYVIFKTLIVKLNISTPGREELDMDMELDIDGGGVATLKSKDKFATMAAKIYEGLGESSNIVSVENCITRLRIEVRDGSKIDQKKIKEANVSGIKVTGQNSIQIIVGPQVQFVAEEIEKLR